MDEPDSKRFLIGVVGPCGSGKSTLVAGLEQEGYQCRHIAQEHSYVPSMCQNVTNPDLLVFLNASFETCTQRRRLNWNSADYQEQQNRLMHARQHADIIIETDSLTTEEVRDRVLEFLRAKR